MEKISVRLQTREALRNWWLLGHVRQFPDATHPAICAREVKPKVFRTVPTWLSTVRSEMNRRAPISRLVNPSATSCATCVPRRLSAPECPGFLTASAAAGAASLLALLGLRYPVRMLPILLFESMWKLTWFAVVALPQLVGDRMDAATTELFAKNLWVVIILAVIPWGYVARQ